jgi:hypothetical protein
MLETYAHALALSVIYSYAYSYGTYGNTRVVYVLYGIILCQEHSQCIGEKIARGNFVYSDTGYTVRFRLLCLWYWICNLQYVLKWQPAREISNT